MKKILLGFLCIVFYLPMYPSSYEELRQNFKDRLYKCQIMLMQDKNKYYECIEPFIKEAEKNLAIIQYCMVNPDLEDITVYFNCLLAYSSAFFEYYVNPDAVRTIGFREKENIAHLEDSAKNLMDVIKTFKEKENIADLNVKQEYNNTINILQKANKTYHKELPIRARIAICITSYINFIRSSLTIHTGLTVHRPVSGINFTTSLY